MTTQTDVTVLGLGGMGSALAEALLRHRHRITVWNRSPERAAPFADRASVAAQAPDAVAASPLVVVCLADYDGVGALLEPLWPDLRGKVVANVGSSTPAESRAMAQQAASQDVRYLDGAIASYPARMGDASTLLFYAGDRGAFDEHREPLLALGGASVFTGSDAGGASVCDQGWLSVLGGFLIGMLQAAAYADAEAVSLEAVFSAIPAYAVEMTALGEELRSKIEAGDYTGDQASLEVYVAPFDGLVTAARDSGVSTSFPAYLSQAVADAVAAGHGDEQFAALFEVLRRRGETGH